jgi:multidrug efflux pump subunit AcrA (membrane-fusion protein)
MTQIMKSASRWVFIAIVIAGAIGAAWWFTRTPAQPEPVASVDPHAGMDMGPDTTPRPSVSLSADAAKRIGVTFATVERGALDDEVRTVGIVAYDETRVKTISPKLDGYVEQLNVAFAGQPVEQGAPLLTIYSPMVVTAEQELLLAVKLAGELGARGDAGESAAALVAAARRRLRSWDVPDEVIARVEQTGEVMRTLTLRAPVRGVVVALNVRAGQRVMAGDALYQVADLSDVWLEGEVFERDLASVSIGNRVTADFAALPGLPREGRITFMDPVLNADTRTVRVRVELSNRDLALKPGMYATLQIHSVRGTVLHVPRSAVLITGQRAFVFIKDGTGSLVPRDVVIGKTTADRVEIMRGVIAGETVVGSATFLVDAESNLSSVLGAMAGMPGMAPPPKPKAPARGAVPDSMTTMPGVKRGR